MNWLLDIAVAAIFALTVFFAWKNGFIKTLVSAASFAICLAVTVIFVSPLSNAIQRTGIAERVKNTTEEHISNYLADSSLSGVEELFEGKSEAFNTLIRVAGIDNETLKSWYAENDGASDRGNVRLAARISEPLVSLLSSLAAVIILFFGTKLILFILSRVLDGVMHLPVLRTCNKVFGILLGILLALVRVALLCFVVKILTENKLFIGSDIISGIDPEKTLLFKIFYGFDLFGFLKSLL